MAAEASPQALHRPLVSVVSLVYNRRDKLRESLKRTLCESQYGRERLQVIVVDNASSDGSAAMVRREFPDVEVVAREANAGVSAWNDGFARARGEFVLALDDDCYLPPDGLTRAVQAAEHFDADLVSFSIASADDPTFHFSDHVYRAGLLSFWGCAVLMRRAVLSSLGGYDPAIFLWGNEVEFLLRFFDRGFRHLHCPEITAFHMKPPADREPRLRYDLDGDWYSLNTRNEAYIAGKLLRWQDALPAMISLLLRNLSEGALFDPTAFAGLRYTVKGFIDGLRRRQPVGNPELSRIYRRNFQPFAGPWWVHAPVGVLIREAARRIARPDTSAKPLGDRRDEFFLARAPFYPTSAGTLGF